MFTLHVALNESRGIQKVSISMKKKSIDKFKKIFEVNILVNKPSLLVSSSQL